MSNSVVLGNDLRLLEGSSRLNVTVIRFSSTLLHHPSLLRTFGFSAISHQYLEDGHNPITFVKYDFSHQILLIRNYH